MNYKERFYKHYGLDKCDVLPCIICGGVARNLHHVIYGKGKKNNNPTNLVPMCSICHDGHHSLNKPTTELIKSKQLLTYLPF